jgi:peptide/nickel transport system substrate-binding protein
VSADPKDPTNYYNDASWCDKEYDRLYAQQKVELDPAKRRDIVHQMLTRFYRSATYDALYMYPDTQAYRKGRFTGWTQQPEKVGPVIFSNTSPTYANLRPVSATSKSSGGDGGGMGAAGIIGIGLVIALAAAGVLWALMRRRSADERE